MPQKGGIGSHTRAYDGLSNDWLTPPEIVKELGPFDFDPCAGIVPRPWDTANINIAPPRNGLKCKWVGRIWLNPPYGSRTKFWLEKMAHHGDGTALIFARTETAMWTEFIWPHAKAILFLSGRLYFYRPDGVVAEGNAGGPSALIAYSNYDVKRLERSNIKGSLVTTWRRKLTIE